MHVSRLPKAIVRCQVKGCEENALFLFRISSVTSGGIDLMVTCEKHTSFAENQPEAVRLPPRKAGLPIARKAAAS